MNVETLARPEMQLCLCLDTRCESVWYAALAMGETYADRYVITIRCPKVSVDKGVRMAKKHKSDLQEIARCHESYDGRPHHDTQYLVDRLEGALIREADPVDMLRVWDPRDYFDGIWDEIVEWVRDHPDADGDRFADYLISQMDPDTDPDTVDVFFPTVENAAPIMLEDARQELAF